MELLLSKPSSLHPHKGLLNSVYKEDVAYSFSHLKKRSIFKLKSKARKSHNRLCCTTGAILKVTMFAIVILLILF